SGVAGPGGGTAEKPVGMVWIAVSGPKTTETSVQYFASDRERNILRASTAALDMLRLMLKNN
ncbi:MAG TPA: CinA family protein, partial [Prolixibacteraceae bacterium]|nr:CinA family protein [Prolixibacteraceae bacterium]